MRRSQDKFPSSVLATYYCLITMMRPTSKSYTALPNRLRHRRQGDLNHSERTALLSLLKAFCLSLLVVLQQTVLTSAFVSLQRPSRQRKIMLRSPSPPGLALLRRPLAPTSLSVWWFGGSEVFEGQPGDSESDSCELVPVRIERTSPNSRRIFGEIVVPNVPIEEVWSILTAYDQLSIHVPNLVESKILSRTSPGQPGDGQFTCKLFQKGAQKIVGFEFGASVTMNMREEFTNENERCIYFQCVDSFFFQEFDGEWRVVDRHLDNGGVECILSYVVDVVPKGPVPVAALEWRIREDVPTNLRALKRAATEQAKQPPASTVKLRQSVVGRQALMGNLRNSVTWERSETMAAYLDKQ